MGLFDSYMPGETYGMPTGGLLSGGSKFNDPLLQIGLGILANNNSKNFSQVVGRGALQGIGNVQQQQQLQLQNQYQQTRQKQLDSELKQQEKINKALEGFDQKFPQYAGLADIDPKSALKIAYPELAKAQNAPDPYFTPISTSSGLGSFDNRSGKFVMVQGADGQPVVKAADDPTLQGNISANKSFGTNLYQPTDMQPGTIKTKSQLAIEAGAPPINQLPQLPQAPQQAQGLPYNIIADPSSTPAELKRLQDLAARDYAQNGSNMPQPQLPMINNGIRVPTPAEQAAATEQAKANVELNMKPKIDSAVTTAKAQTDAQLALPQTIEQGNNTIKLVDDLLSSPGFKDAVGFSSYNPLNKLPGSAANDFNVRLDQIKGGQFLQAYQTLRGGGQITEVEGKKATDAISRMNTSVSEEEFTKAAREFQDVIRKGLERAKAKAGNNSNTPTRSRADILKQYGVSP